MSSWRIRLADMTEVVFTQNLINVSSIFEQEPDPDWTFTDKEGHEHYWEDNLHPTLEERWEDYLDDPHDSDPYLVGYFCNECGEQVKPKFRSAGLTTSMISGMREMRREGWLPCSSQADLDAIPEEHMTGSMRFSPGTPMSVQVNYAITPAQALELAETIGLHSSLVPSKEGYIAGLKGLVASNGVVAGVQQGPEVR